MKDTSKLSTGTGESFPSLLELAANNDVEAFTRSIELDLSAVDEAGLWYIRKRGSKQITLEERTPLMVAAAYGSIDVLKLIVALPDVDLNRLCGKDKWSALHCAAFGGSVNSFAAVKMLLSAGADPSVEDADGLRPVDVIIVPPMLPSARAALEELLMNNTSNRSLGTSNASSPVLSPSPDTKSPRSRSDSETSPMAPKFSDHPNSEKKQYPVDPSLPDIRNGIYSTDEFRMFSFKVRPCSRAYSHDWTECPFVHPGENARRRDPRKFHYSCVPCPEFRKGACRRADMCEYAHGVFECWLHPAQYRTRLCKDGTSCERQVCFFAHTPEELRPLYGSSGSGVLSPRSAASAAGFMDMAAALSLIPGSPPSHSIMNLSPTANGIPHASSAWPQPNVPTLHLPGSNFQSSRLRSSLSARDIPPEDLNLLHDFDAEQLIPNDLAYFSQAHPKHAMLNRPVRSPSLTPSNLEELFSAETGSSPRFSDPMGVFSPTHRAAVFNQCQQQQQPMNIPPVNANMFSPRSVDHPFLQGSFGGVSSSPRMSPRSLETAAASPMSGPRLSPVPTWSKWGPSNGKVDWSVTGDDPHRLKRSFVVESNNRQEPDVSWVQSLVKETPSPPPPGETLEKAAAGSRLGNCETDIVDESTIIGGWLEQMQMDQQQLAAKLS